MKTTDEKLMEYYDDLVKTIIEEIKEKVTLPVDGFLRSNVLGMVGTKLILDTNKEGQTYHDKNKFEDIMNSIYNKLKNNACIIERIKTTDPDYLFHFKWNFQKEKLKKFNKNEKKLVPAYIDYVDFDSVFSIILRRDEDSKEILKITLEKDHSVMFFIDLLHSYAIANGYDVVEVVLDDYTFDELN